MSAEYPIPRNLADAFGEMILNYAAGDWTPSGEDYLRVSIDRVAYGYESACNLIDIFDDALPEDLLRLLSANIHYGDDDLKEDLATKGSYSSAARALRLLMQRRKEAYRKREEARRERE
jgi:hypothetical protein